MKRDFTVCFYNVENFFDIEDDPDTSDGEFTPSGPKKWNRTKYLKKIENLAEVIKGMGLKHTLPAFIGLCEVENREVIEDLLEHRDLDHEDYGIVHEESRDVRGIDVALCYSKNVFEYQGHYLINFEERTGESFDARDILYTWGKLANGEMIHFFVNHWPSRRKGQRATEYKRIAAAEALREQVDQIRAKDEDAHIVIMGDFNDEPRDKSLRSILAAREKGQHSSDLVNLGWPIYKRQWGTVTHEGDWYMFDMFIVSENMLEDGPVEVHKHRMKVYDEGETLYKIPRSNKVKPNRTYVGLSFKDGYSDHLAVFLRLTLHFKSTDLE